MKNSILSFSFTENKKFFYLLIIIIFIPYVRSVRYPFIGFDDTNMIPGNYAFISKISNIPEAFIRSVDYNPLKGQQTEMTNAYYRPMLTVSLILNAQIAGQSPFFYHIINILLHIF